MILYLIAHMYIHNEWPVGFMGYGDLWGFNSIVLIFYKSRMGFMGIYITQSLSINPHKSCQFLFEMLVTLIELFANVQIYYFIALFGQYDHINSFMDNLSSIGHNDE